MAPYTNDSTPRLHILPLIVIITSCRLFTLNVYMYIEWRRYKIWTTLYRREKTQAGVCIIGGDSVNHSRTWTELILVSSLITSRVAP